ncbi:MAG: hypothetical protein LQ344_006357 [Seirophora lacunosa]|nr:MAG: hypothetical protein LQ344_006357 [Seirophora lacunosa]
MLTESFIASIRTIEKKANATTAKDTGIHLHEFQPNPALKSSFRKSSTQPNCIAVNATHIFAAQADKSVVHVYSRQRNNQEAIVPFQEQITCLALAGRYDGAGTLVMGTHGGRLILWELATGRQISTPQSHLQPVTCIAVDPTFNFILSGSSDSNLHVWSLPSLLSFLQPSPNDPSQPVPLTPFRTLTDHRAAINSVVFGHSVSKANLAVSAAKDQTCIVWDYRNGVLLHTYLLASNPLCLALDPADRAAYVGYEDGSIQLLDFYKQASLLHPLYDPNQQSTPTQPTLSDRWHSAEASSSPVLCLQVSYDGTSLVSGHENGKVHQWNIPKGKYNVQIVDFFLPVTNLLMLPPIGFPTPTTSILELHHVIKPRYESSLFASRGTGSSSIIPSNYTFTAKFTSTLPLPDSPAGASELDDALTNASFPTSMLEDGITELAALRSPPTDASPGEHTRLKAANEGLKTQLDAALCRQREAIARVLKLEEESFQRREDEAVKKARKKRRRIRMMEAEERAREVVMGETVKDRMEAEGDEGTVGDGEDGLSSDTDEMSSE